MKALLLISLFLISSSAAPTSEDAQAKIIKYDNDNDGEGNYEFSFETSNGLQRSETGTLVNKGQLDEYIEVRGSYSYIDPDGKTVVVYYTADENGFHIDEGDLGFREKPVPASLPSGVVASLLGR